MSVTIGVRDLLTAKDTVQTLAAGRVYLDVLPRDYQFPAVVLHRYGATQETDFKGPVGIREVQVQGDVYGRTAEERDALHEAVVLYLTGSRTQNVPGFKGPLPNGLLVQACLLEREQDMPYLPNADRKGTGFRSMWGIRVFVQS